MTPKKSNLFMLLFLIYFVLAQIIYFIILLFINIDINRIFLQAFTSIITFLIFFIICSIVSKKNILGILPLKPLSILSVVLIILISLSLLPLMNLLSAFSMLYSKNDISDLMLETSREAGFWANLTVLAATPAILEEILMRGIVLDGYKNVNLIKCALINGLFFGLMHLNLQQFLYAALLGFVFVFLVHYTKSIYASMLAHFTINSVSVLSVFLMESDTSVISEQVVSTTADLWLSISYLAFAALISIPFLMMFFVLFIIANKKVVTRLPDERYGTYDCGTPAELEILSHNKPKVVGWEFFIIIIVAIFIIFLNYG